MKQRSSEYSYLLLPFCMKKLLIAIVIAIIAGGGWGIAYFIFG
jgi:hypothetical protein